MLSQPQVDEEHAHFAALRQREFSRLDAQGITYVDYTGAALYGESQVLAHARWLTQAVMGNPHAEHAPAHASTLELAQAKRLVFEFFDIDDSTHEICFTANASAAIKLVAESYPFSSDRHLVLTADNHNSVLGMREYAKRAGAAIHLLSLDAELRLQQPHEQLRAFASQKGGLLALPAQSNFSGVLHPLNLIQAGQKLGLRVLLDAAAYVATHHLSLKDCPADFLALSFYKLFGYPTGIGALIARREALRELQRPWFAGGTVNYASVVLDRHRLQAGGAGFGDGTPDFLGVAGLAGGFQLLREVGMPAITRHVQALTGELLAGMQALRHPNGAPLVAFYGPRDMMARGATVAFNVLDRQGKVLAFRHVEELAKAHRIALRGGCFCNPGAAEAAFSFAREALAPCLERLDRTFTSERLAACMNAPVGALRCSLGLANNAADIERTLAFLVTLTK